MADDWQLERASNVFFLGDLFEASVVQANHMPFRVFVDTCVATLDPDMNSVPSYAFIDKKGCLMDSKLTNSRSQFLKAAQYEGGAVLGPILVQEATQDVPESCSADHGAEGSSEAVVMAGVMAAVGLICLIVLGTVLVWRHYKHMVL
ncbi:hypothetical protein SKAU_G00362370 [Synaphobranchus kaupii]|uniref:ZP-C domain-containing protein n=1 Tax=Synaphobranchus kaupii TaxID=118154 RepID=A0A9Q1IH83_SYNKA|nr:hypothetical protein SKAU_G00362370 [Synaphobranchus kaupii]